MFVLDGAVLALIAYPLLAAWVVYELLHAGSRGRTFMVAVFIIYLVEVARVTLFPIPVDDASVYVPTSSSSSTWEPSTRSSAIS